MLSAELFAHILSMVPTTPESARPSVRRAPRVEHPCQMEISLGNDQSPGARSTIDVKDFSARGIGFVSPLELPVGAPFVAHLDSSDGRHVRILSTVVHSQRYDQSQQLYGAEFTCLLDQTPEYHAEPTAEDLMVVRSSIID